MKHLAEDDLILYYYGETTDAPAAEHLEACSQCEATYRRLVADLGRLGHLAAPVPERGADYAQQVWRRLEPRLESSGLSLVESWGRWFRLPQLMLAGSMAALLLMAFWLGRTTGPVATPVPEQVRERVLLVAVGDHLERSQRLLVELIHLQGEEDGAGSQQETAARLAADNRLYRESAARVGDETVASLLDELERLLLEVANATDGLGANELTHLRNRIERRGILFKIRVIGDEARRQGRAVPDSEV